MADKVIWLTDRSRTVLDWACPRKRFHNYHSGGRGVVPAHTPLELMLGTCLHDGLAAIATQHRAGGEVDIDTISTVASGVVLETLMTAAGGDESQFNFAREQSTLVEGLLRGFYLRAWPSLMAQYPTIISIEEEMTYSLSEGITFMSRPDLVLADRDGNWFYIEYKSTSSKNEEWVNQWQTAVQVHSTIRAIEHTLGTAPSAVIVQGLYKGYRSYEKQNSPLCYAYYRQGTPPFSYPEWQYAYKSGFKRVPVWEMEGGVKAWVEGMPEVVLGDQFPQTPPIYIKDRLVEDFFQQRLIREVEIKEAMKVVENPEIPEEMRKQFLDAFFGQRFDQCNPGWGKPCGYRQLCFGSGGNPLDQGWVPRQSHHQLEMEQHQQEEETKNAQI